MTISPHVTTRQQLLSAGRGHDHGDRRVRTGTWSRAAPSVYVSGPLDLAERVAAARAHAGADGVVTGWAACVLLGLPYVPDGGAVPVLVPPGRRRVSTAAVRVMPTVRPPRWWLSGGVRVAAPARAVVDAARALRDLRSVRALVLSAGALVPPGALRDELEQGAKGASALCRRALDDLDAGAVSAPEAELADLVAAAVHAGRLPPYLLNPDLVLADTLLGRPDGWLVGLGLGWELDSRQHHAGEDAFEATLARSDRFLAAGVALLHLTTRRVRDEAAGCVETLVAAAEARRRSGGREPDGLLVVPRGPLQRGRGTRPGRP